MRRVSKYFSTETNRKRHQPKILPIRFQDKAHIKQPFTISKSLIGNIKPTVTHLTQNHNENYMPFPLIETIKIPVTNSQVPFINVIHTCNVFNFSASDVRCFSSSKSKYKPMPLMQRDVGQIESKHAEPGTAEKAETRTKHNMRAKLNKRPKYH